MISKLLKKGQLAREESSQREIDELFLIVDRDLKDCQAEFLSEDWQFGIAYNAALKLATILIRAHGYRVRGNGFHLNTIQLIPEFLGKKHIHLSIYLESCRRKRNLLEYDSVGGVTAEEVRELQEFVVELRELVIKKLKISF